RFLLSFGPPTQSQDGTIRLACDGDLLELAQPAWLEPHPSRIEAEGLALPRRQRARGRAARVGPARSLPRWLQARPIACPIAQQPHLRPRGNEPAEEFDHGDMALYGTVPWRGLAPPPSPPPGPALWGALAPADQATPAPARPSNNGCKARGRSRTSA